MKLKLSNIQILTNDMIIKRIDRQKINFIYNSKTVEIMYFIDTSPYEMIIGVRGTSVGFSTEVNKYGEVANWIENYYELCEALGIKPNQDKHFTPSVFFNMINNHIPTCAKEGFKPNHCDALNYCKNIYEANKIYFQGYRDNTKDGGNVSDRNYLKTMIAFGKDTADICRRKNVSTRWTDSKENSVNFFG